MDMKKITYIITNRLEGLTLAIPMFVVGLGFMILGVSLFPGIGILVGIFYGGLHGVLCSVVHGKSQIKEALKRIKEKHATLLSSSISKYRATHAKTGCKK